MSRSRAQEVLRLGLELAVVFLGVVIALGADSWVQGRDDQRRLDSHLRALESDMATAQASLQTQLNQTVADHDEADRLVQQLLGPEREGDPGAFGTLTWADNPSIPDGTFNTLVATGDINLLSDSLRIGIVTAHSALDPDWSHLAQLYSAGTLNVREHIFTMSRIATESGLPFGSIPLAIAREEPDMIASMIMHAGLLESRHGALESMLATIAGLQKLLSPHAGTD